MLRRACDIWGHAARFSAMTLHEVASERFSRGCPQSFSTLVSWQQGCSSECASDKLFGQETLRRASSSLPCGTALAKDRSKWGPCVQFYGFAIAGNRVWGPLPLKAQKVVIKTARYMASQCHRLMFHRASNGSQFLAGARHAMT